MITSEMREILWALVDKYENKELEEICPNCPYASRCEKEGLWWGCPCWEESMGADL